MKKVVMILGNHFFNDTRVFREADSLAKEGYEVKIFSTFGKDLPDYERINKFEVIRLPVKNYSPFRGFYRPSFYKAYNKLVQESGDIYHCHDLDTLLIGYLAAKANGAKVVYDAHEYWSSRALLSKALLDPVKKFIREPLLHFMEKWLIKKIDAVITVNETIAETLANDYGIKKPIIIYNFSSSENKKNSGVLRSSLGLNNKKIILYLGGINKGRGVLQLVESIKYLPVEFNLVFLGEGPYKEYAEKLAKELKLTSRIHFIKSVPPNEVVKWASGADIGVSPIQNISKSYYYSSPNKVFEYLMAGLPIAVSDFPEMRKILSRYEVGETFNPDDPKSVAEAIKRIFVNESHYKRLKENVLKAVNEKYNWEKESEKLIDLYKNLDSNIRNS